MIKRFSMFGNLDQVVHQLRTVKAISEETGKRHVIHVTLIPGETQGNAAVRMADILPLIRAQSYVARVTHSLPFSTCYNLDEMEPVYLEGKWLDVPLINPVSKVVIHWANTITSEPPQKEWREFCREHVGQCTFLGSPHELKMFRARTGVGRIWHKSPRNYLEAACSIAGCELFAGNRSVMAHIAEGIGIKTAMEVNGVLVLPEMPMPGWIDRAGGIGLE